MNDYLRSVLSASLFSHYTQIVFKDNLKISEELCQDLQTLLNIIKNSEHLPYLQNSNPHLWLPPILLTIFSSFPTSQSSSSSIFILSTELLKSFLSLPHPTPYIQEILFSSNGILKNIIRTLTIFEDCPNTSFYSLISSHSLSLIHHIYSNHSSNFPFIANLIQVLLTYIKSPIKSKENIQLQVCSLLNEIIPKYFSIFSEFSGPEIIISALGQSFNSSSMNNFQVALINMLTLSIKSTQASRFIQDSQILMSLKFVFVNKLFSIYSAVLIFINSLLNELPSAINEVISSNLPVFLAESVEYFLPCDALLIEQLLKFLTIFSHSVEGCQIISSFSVITRIVEALANCNDCINNDLCVGVGEYLQELANQVPAVVEKSVEGCINVMALIKESSGEDLLRKLKNMGKIFRFCFCFTSEIIFKYFKRTCFDDILDLIRMPPRADLSLSTLRSLLKSLKHLPSTLLSDFLIKTIHSFCQILIQVQELAGPLYLIQDFSQVSNKNDELMQNLNSINIHIEVLRVIILSSGISSNHYQEFSNCLINLGFLKKICINEYASIRFRQEKHPLALLSMDLLEENTEKSVLELILSISKLFSSCSQACCLKSQQNLVENSTFCILKSLGEILGSLLNQIQVSVFDEKNNFVACVVIRVVCSIIFKEKTFSISLLYSFYSALGIQNIYRLLGDIKNCFRNNEIGECYLRELWVTSLELLRSLVTIRTQLNVKEHFLLMSLGCSDAKLFIKDLKTESFFYFKQSGFEQSSPFYEEFKKIELDIIDYFTEHTIDYFIENIEKNEHFYYHIEAKQKLCRNVIQNRGFLIKMETLSVDLIEMLIEFPSYSQKISDILVKLAKTCELIQQEILDNLFKELQIVAISIFNGKQSSVMQLAAIIESIIQQNKCPSSYLQVFYSEIIDSLLGLLVKIQVNEEDQNVFEGIFRILSNCFGNCVSQGVRIMERLVSFLEKVEFEVGPKFFESISEVFVKLSQCFDDCQKLNKKKIVKVYLRMGKKTGCCKDELKYFQSFLMNFYECKQVKKEYYCSAIREFIGDKKVYLHNFLNNFCEDVVKNKEIFLSALFECCIVHGNFVEFRGYCENNIFGSQKIVYETFRILNKYMYSVNPTILIHSITLIIKKHPAASQEIFEYYQATSFNFICQIVTKRYQSTYNNYKIDYFNNSTKIPESDFNTWLRITFIFWKTLINQATPLQKTEIFQELKQICASDTILHNFSLCKVLNYYIQSFIQSSDSKKCQFFNSLCSLYQDIGTLLTKFSLKNEISYFFFSSFLETFEIIQSINLNLNEDPIYEEEISESSESSDKQQIMTEKSENSSTSSEHLSEEVEENTSEYSQKSFSSSAGSSFEITINSSFQEPALENTLTTIDILQVLEIEIKEYFLNIRPLPSTSKQNFASLNSTAPVSIQLPVLPISLKSQIFNTLIKSLYIENNVNENLISLILLQFYQDKDIGKQVVNTLAGQLVVDGFERKYLDKGEYLFSLLTLRVLNILNHMSSLSPLVAIELILKSAGFTILLRLFQNPLFKNSSYHLFALSQLFKTLAIKLGIQFPILSKAAINSITQLLYNPLHTEKTQMMLSELINTLARLPLNRELAIESISDSLIKVATSTNLFILHNTKEIQLLQICKLLKSLGGKLDIIDFLWEKLSDILISHKSSLISFVPAIETFFICHLDRPNSASFQIFSLKTQKQINLLIKQHPSLLLNVFNCLVTRFPSLIDFENKRNYFRDEMRIVQKEAGQDVIRLHVRRQEVFMDSYHQLKDREPSGMYGKLRIQFINEEGLDAGGLTREWYGLLARAMFNANFALFIPSANGVSFQPNSMSSINTEHIQFFKFVGRIIGKALCDGYPLDLYFTRSFYKHILGQEVNYQDMEDLDLDFYKSLKSLMDINLNESELHEYYFAYEEEEFGRHKIKELVPGGRTKRVTEENKIDYIKLLCHMKMTKNIQAQIDAFNSGFHELIPIDLISIFDSKELELLISGLPEVDLEDLKNNTDYINYSSDSLVIVWLWEVLYEFSHEERAEFIQFVTGSSKVPLEGFKALPGLGGTQKFQIHKSFTSDDRLPTAHTCMNQLDLPEYATKEKLKNRLKLAISEGKEGFGFI